MKNYRFAALIGALLLVCGIVAWQWYARAGSPGASAPSPVQAITAAPVPAATSTPPIRRTAATAAPVVFVPQTAAPASGATPTSTSAPGPEASATATPQLEAATPAPQGAPVPLVTLAPTAALPGVVREPADAPPRILALSLSTPVAHGGDVVSGFVETSSNVASVEARIAGYSSSMRKIGVGKFVMTYRVPRLPFFLHKTYTIEVIARNTRGEAVSSDLPITIR